MADEASTAGSTDDTNKKTFLSIGIVVATIILLGSIIWYGNNNGWWTDGENSGNGSKISESKSNVSRYAGNMAPSDKSTIDETK
ncbi:hypothetical protein OCOL_001774 [Ordospora colligata]